MAVIPATGGTCRRCQVAHEADAQFCNNCRLYLPDTTQTVERVTFTRRLFGSWLLEGILFILTLIIGWFIWLIFSAQKSQSPAKSLTGIYIINVETGKAAGAGEVWLRDVVLKIFLSGLVPFGGFINAISILVDKNRQALLYDKIIKTAVVYAPNGLPDSMRQPGAAPAHQPQPAIAQAAAPPAYSPPPQPAAAPAPVPPPAGPAAPLFDDQTIVSSAAPAQTQDVASQLRELRRLLDERLISEEEYETKRADLARRL
jgi:hypothetical protein